MFLTVTKHFPHCSIVNIPLVGTLLILRFKPVPFNCDLAILLSMVEELGFVNLSEA